MLKKKKKKRSNFLKSLVVRTKYKIKNLIHCLFLCRYNSFTEWLHLGAMNSRNSMLILAKPTQAGTANNEVCCPTVIKMWTLYTAPE